MKRAFFTVFDPLIFCFHKGVYILFMSCYKRAETQTIVTVLSIYSKCKCLHDLNSSFQPVLLGLSVLYTFFD